MSIINPEGYNASTGQKEIYDGNDTIAGTVPPARTITAGTGLSGGGDLSADRTISLANTAVTPGSYTSANLTVDAQGRITAASSGSGGTVINQTAAGRLTLVSGSSVMTTSQTAKTTIYYTPHNGNAISLYNGTTWDVITFSEASLSLGGFTANSNYDIWGYNNSGTLALEATIWTNDTTRATAIVQQDGVYVKSGTATRRYLGTIRITGTTGQCEFSFGSLAAGGGEAKLFVWNSSNRVNVTALVQDSTDSWSYTSTTWRAANNSSTNRVSFVTGQAFDAFYGTYHNEMSTSSTSINAFCGVGYDSTSSPSGIFTLQNTTTAGSIPGSYTAIPSVGSHFLTALEKSSGSTSTFYGDNGAGASAGLQSGLYFVFSM